MQQQTQRSPLIAFLEENPGGLTALALFAALATLFLTVSIEGLPKAVSSLAALFSLYCFMSLWLELGLNLFHRYTHYDDSNIFAGARTFTFLFAYFVLGLIIVAYILLGLGQAIADTARVNLFYLATLGLIIIITSSAKLVRRYIEPMTNPRRKLTARVVGACVVLAIIVCYALFAYYLARDLF